MTTYIYGLFDPRNDVIRYVGKSNNPQLRLNAHISTALRGGSCGPVAQWILELDELGLRPELVLLEDVRDAWDVAEPNWISSLREQGYPLLNTHSGGQSHGQKPKKPTPPPPRWWHPERGFYALDALGLELTVKPKAPDGES